MPAHITLILPVFLSLHAILVYVLPASGLSAWPVNRTWGFGHVALFPNWMVPAYILGALVTIPPVNKQIQAFVSIILDKIQLVCIAPVRVAAAAGIFYGFWMLRQKYALLGDGYTWIDNVAAGNFEDMGGLHILWAVYPRVLHAVMKVLSLDPFETVQVSSCLFGVLFTFLAWHYSSSIAATRWGQVASLGIILSSGVIQFYFGYGEAYPPVPVLTLALASTGVRALDARATYGLALLVCATCLIWHPFMISLAPACAYLLWKSTPRHRRLLTWLVFPALGFATMASLYFRLERHDTFLPILPSAEFRYAILGLPHLWERINAIVLTSPAILMVVSVAVPSLLGRLRERDATAWFLLSIAIPMVSVAAFSNVLLGALDWDIMSAMCFPLVLLSAYAVQCLPDEATAKHIATASVVFSLLNSAPWVIANHTDRSFQTMKTFMENEPVDYFLAHESSVRLGTFAYRAGRNDVAISALEDGRSKDPGNASILFNLAGKYYAAGRYEESLTETVRALEGAPRYVKAYRLMIASLNQLGRKNQADSLGEKYLVYLAKEGRIALLESRFQLAAANYDAVIRMGAKEPEIYVNLGAAYIKFGRYEEAETTLMEGLSLFPNRPGLLWNLAQVQSSKGNPEPMKATLEVLLRLKPDWERKVVEEFGVQ